MATSAKLSVIVPTIGRPKYITATISSLANQTRQDFRLVISDNASTPCFTELNVPLRRFNSLQLIRHDVRKSFSSHFNACIQSCETEWCVFVSDDDIVAPNFVETALTAIESFPDMAVFFPGQKQIDAEWEAEMPSLPETLSHWNGNAFIEAVLSGSVPNVLTAVSMVARRDQLLKAGGFPGYPAGAHSDSYLWAYLSQLGSTVLSQVTMGYRVYSASVGLSMPFKDLLEATNCFEGDLKRLLRGTGSGDELLQKWIFSNSACLTNRWVPEIGFKSLTPKEGRIASILLARSIRDRSKQQFTTVLKKLGRSLFLAERTSTRL
jgi:glycosyltransferase involved in cell wall biosynthesis